MASPLERLGSIRLLHRIGRGGMSTVQVGFDTESQRFVAVKALFPEVAHEERVRARFQQEAKVCQRLDHPNIVSFVSTGERPDGAPYIALEYVKGTSLRELMNKVGRLPPGDVLEILEDLTKALDHAHSRGIIHRDIKPQNIVLNQDGILKLIDFGIAQVSGTSGISTATGQVLATYSYAPPEQNQGKEIDQTADLYSVGALAWEMLVGRRFLTGSSPPQIVLQQTMGPPPPPSESVPGLPEELDELIRKLCMPYPEDRYRSASEVWQALRYMRRVLQDRQHSLTFYGDDLHEKWMLAKNAFNNGQLSLAMSLAKYLSKSHPDFAPAHFMLGKLYAERNLPFNSSDSFQRALELKPGNEDYMLDFSLAMVRLGRYQEANREILRLLAQDPRNRLARGFQTIIQELIEARKAAELDGADDEDEAPLWFDLDPEETPEGARPRPESGPGELPLPGILEEASAEGTASPPPPMLESFPCVDIPRALTLSRYLPGLGHFFLGKREEGALLAGFTLLLASLLLGSLLWTPAHWSGRMIQALIGLPAAWGLFLTWRFTPDHTRRLARRLHLRGTVEARTRDGELRINIGRERGVAPRQIYQVLREDQEIGELRIREVEEFGALGVPRILEPTVAPPGVGDRVEFLRD